MDTNSEKNPLYTLVELLFMPMAFYVLTQLSKVDSLQKGVGWFIVFIMVQNEYFSIKDSSPKYNIRLYLSDIWSIFMYWFALNAVTKSNPVIGYDPLFWIYLSGIWFGYAIWDWVMIYHEESSHKKEDYRRWRNNMFICFIITLLCGVALLSIQPTAQPNIYVLCVLQLLPLGCVFWALVGWWLRSFLAKHRTKQSRTTPDVV